MPKKTIDLSANVLICLGLAAALAGCQNTDPRKAVAYDLPTQDRLLELDKVVLVAFPEVEGYPGLADNLTDEVVSALRSRKLFRLEVIPRSNAACAMLGEPDGPLNYKQLSEFRKALGCNAIIVGCVRRFSPPPRMGASVYMQMVDLRRGKLLWAVEHDWDTTDKAVEARAKSFFDHQMRSGYDPANAWLVMNSPKVFTKYLAYEISRTLPSREEILQEQARQAEELRRQQRRNGANAKLKPPIPTN